MPTSMVRNTAIAVQADPAVPVATPDRWLNYIKSCTIEPVVTSEIMDVEGGTRAMAAARIPGTVYSRVRLGVYVDSREFPLLLLAGAGYSYATGVHHLFFGDDPATYLALWRYSGITGQAWYVDGLILNTIALPRDYTGNGTGEATLEFLGNARTSGTDPGATLTPPATHYVPFTARQSVLKYNGAAFCPLTSTVNLNNNVQPRYCGPSADALTTDPAYLAPDELQARKAEGTINVTAQFVGYTGSPLADADTATERAMTLKMRDPAGTPTELAWTFPRVSLEPGTTEDGTDNPEQRLTVTGTLLRNADGRIALLDVTNDESAYL